MTQKSDNGTGGDGEEFARLIADVYELSGRLREEGERIAAGAGQTQARWQLMSVVSERPLTVPQAARRLGISRQGAQRTANDLLDAGLAALVENPDHRVSKLLELTAAGCEALAAITVQAGEFNARLEDAAGARDLAKMRRTIADLLAALD
jgi:DNA-binding MarR family transcriptional regulator